MRPIEFLVGLGRKEADMRLTWRDGVAAVFAALAGVVALAVILAWDWPLLGSYRAGIVALLAIGVPMCLIGGYAYWDSPAFRHPTLVLKDPFLTVAAALGFVAVGLSIAGLVLGTQGPFVGLVAVMGALWLIATIRHAVEGTPRATVTRAAGTA